MERQKSTRKSKQEVNHLKESYRNASAGMGYFHIHRISSPGESLGRIKDNFDRLKISQDVLDLSKYLYQREPHQDNNDMQVYSLNIDDSEITLIEPKMSEKNRKILRSLNAGDESLVYVLPHTKDIEWPGTTSPTCGFPQIHIHTPRMDACESGLIGIPLRLLIRLRKGLEFLTLEYDTEKQFAKLETPGINIICDEFIREGIKRPIDFYNREIKKVLSEIADKYRKE